MRNSNIAFHSRRGNLALVAVVTMVFALAAVPVADPGLFASVPMPWPWTADHHHSGTRSIIRRALEILLAHDIALRNGFLLAVKLNASGWDT